MPTLKEQGTDIVNYGWWGVCAASGTPKPMLETLNKHVAAAVASPEFKTVIEKTGVIPVSSSVDELGALISRHREGIRRADQGARDRAA